MSTYETRIPTEVPENGFYYHYKHSATGPVNNYAYEVIGVGHHTEDDCRPEDANMVVYRPLYDALVYRMGKFFDLRPLEMWMGDAEYQGKKVQRFMRIRNPDIIKELEAKRREMYGT